MKKYIFLCHFLSPFSGYFWNVLKGIIFIVRVVNCKVKCKQISTLHSLMYVWFRFTLLWRTLDMRFAYEYLEVNYNECLPIWCATVLWSGPPVSQLSSSLAISFTKQISRSSRSRASSRRISSRSSPPSRQPTPPPPFQPPGVPLGQFVSGVRGADGWGGRGGSLDQGPWPSNLT